MTSQPCPPQSQLKDDEPSTTGSASIEDTLELQQPSISVVTENRANDEESLQLEPPGLSVLFEPGERTERSIEIGRRALDDQFTGRLSQGSFGTVRRSERSDDLSALGLHNASQPPLDNDLLQITPDADDENLDHLGRQPSLGLVFI